MTKQELRKLYLEKRLALSEDEYHQQSQMLCDNFFNSVKLSTVKVLHIFLPIIKKKEPDTFLIIERLQKEFPAIRISVPKVNAETSILENFYLDSISSLVTTAWGIPEPPSINPTPSSEIDAVILPLLVFDNAGNRLGYGKGFYDKFLITCKSSCRKIGLSFFPPSENITSIEAHDQKLDHVITPTKVYNF